jgi:hypothetical protein
LGRTVQYFFLSPRARKKNILGKYWEGSNNAIPAFTFHLTTVGDSKMKKTFLFVGVLALALTLSPTGLLAKGKSGVAKANNHGLKGLARADDVAGSHGLKGRNVARTRGANKTGFCPPGQAKKSGLGSRFQC